MIISGGVPMNPSVSTLRRKGPMDPGNAQLATVLVLNLVCLLTAGNGYSSVLLCVLMLVSVLLDLIFFSWSNPNAGSA